MALIFYMSLRCQFTLMGKANELKAKVSVVIPNYNGKKYLEDCIESLLNQSVKQFEIIIVDDASSDSSLEDIKNKCADKAEFPLIRYISHENNLGFCASVNDGIKASSCEYVILLNNDTVAEPEFVLNMCKAIKRSHKIFSVSARMVNLYEPDKMDDSGDFYCLLGWAFTTSKDKPVNDFNRRMKVLSACGGAAIYRKSIFDKIGLFDENHFAYLEDVDIGYRAGLYGYINTYEPAAVVKHAGSGTSGSRYNEFKAKLTARNNLYLIYKNMPVYQLIINMPFLVAGTAVKLAFYISKGLGKAYFDGILEGFKLINSSEGKMRKVDFKKAGFINTLKMEIFLIKNTFLRFS